jgi:sensor domain CHASE-containing protein
MTEGPAIFFVATSFLLLIACGYLMLHAKGLRRERDEAKQSAKLIGSDVDDWASLYADQCDALNSIRAELHALMNADKERGSKILERHRHFIRVLPPSETAP